MVGLHGYLGIGDGSDGSTYILKVGGIVVGIDSGIVSLYESGIGIGVILYLLIAVTLLVGFNGMQVSILAAIIHEAGILEGEPVEGSILDVEADLNVASLLQHGNQTETVLPQHAFAVVLVHLGLGTYVNPVITEVHGQTRQGLLVAHLVVETTVGGEDIQTGSSIADDLINLLVGEQATFGYPVLAEGRCHVGTVSTIIGLG